MEANVVMNSSTFLITVSSYNDHSAVTVLPAVSTAGFPVPFTSRHSCVTLSNKRCIGLSHISETKFYPQNTTPQLTVSNSPGVDSQFSIIFSVLDASGRYSSQFLWGNSYWLGSFTLCQQLHFNSRQEGSAPPFPGAYSVVSLRINVTGFTPHVRKHLYRNTRTERQNKLCESRSGIYKYLKTNNIFWVKWT